MTFDDEEDRPLEVDITLGPTIPEKWAIYVCSALAVGLAFLDSLTFLLPLLISWALIAHVTIRETKVFKFATGKSPWEYYVKDRRKND